MFGEAKKLRRELDQIEPWVGLAKIIQAKNAEYAADMPVDVAVNLAVQEASEEQRRAFVEAAFNQLDPEKQLQLLSDMFGDGIFKEALERERALRLDKIQKEAALQDIFYQAREHGFFKSSELPPYTKMKIMLYNSNREISQSGKYMHDPTRVIDAVKLGDVGVNLYQCVNDNALKQLGAGYEMDDLTNFYFTSNGNSENSNLHYGAPIKIRDANNYSYYGSHEEVGPVLINGLDIFEVLPATASVIEAGPGGRTQVLFS